MQILEVFKGAFQAAKEEGIEIEGVSDSTTFEQALAALAPTDPRVAELQAQINTLNSQARRTAAEAWAETQIQARRATVGERAHLVALHLRAAEDDAANPGTEQASRVSTLEASFAARLPHQWSMETIPVTTLPLAQGGGEDTAARRRRLLSMTAVGRTALAQETK